MVCFSPVGFDVYETSLLLFANAWGAGSLLHVTVKCLCPRTHRETNAWGLPGGMLAIGIDSHTSIRQGTGRVRLLIQPLAFN